MKKVFTKLTCVLLALTLCLSIGATAVFAADETESTGITVDLIPGKNTSAMEYINSTDFDGFRLVTVSASEIATVINRVSASGFNGPKPYLKFDRNDTADQKKQQVIHELYTDNGHFTDPSTITVTGAPEGFPFQYVGYGDYSGHYVSKLHIVYDRNEDGTPKLDENGQFVIKQLQKTNGTPLTYMGQPTTNIVGPFDQLTGTRPQHFLLMNEAGETVYAYCIDLGTGVASGNPFYSVANLEDANYYATSDAAEHIRAITQNGYWGTLEGMGSLTQLKSALKQAVADGKIEKEYDITFVIYIQNATADYELKEGEYIGNGKVCTTVTEHIILTDEVIDELTSGEAIDATQAAIWSYANGSNHALDGTDRDIVGDITYASSKNGDSRNGQNDFAGAARTKALYNYLTTLETSEESTVVINKKNFIKDMSLTVGNHLGNGVYEASLNFATYFTADVEKDDLAIVLTYVDADGNQQTITCKLTGEGALLPNADGFYALEGLKLREDQKFNFSLNVAGAQFLENNTYIFAAEGGVTQSQTMVGVASGYNTVDITTSLDATFSVKDIPSLNANKESLLIDRGEDRYTISIEVPGGDRIEKHDEIILMVDGSYSMDNEWPSMKEAINLIGKTVLNGNGNTQLTLMAFGMGDNIVLEHVKDANTLATALGELPGNLLYGRSSTNCEAGFTGVASYIENHDETLGNVEVIFISDGNVNTDETPRAFDANWQTWSVKFGALTVAQAAFEGTLTYGKDLPDAFKMFGDRFAGATREEILERAFAGEVSDEEFINFAEQLWSDVYAYSGLIRGMEYPVSDTERAFVKYDKENGTYIQDLFYYTTYKSPYVTYGNRWTRTPIAADALASMEQVNALYVVDYDNYTAWMDTGISNEKATFVQSNGISGLCQALEGVLADMALSDYYDVSVTDYMSKWVTLDPTTLRIVDATTETIIWSAADGWLIEDNRPTAQEVPVIAELVDPANYAAGGEDVIGNTSGDIYLLTWYVKDGPMLRSDNYRLEYEVTVDTAEEGFDYEVSYPANGKTTIRYNDDRDSDIPVPTVITCSAEVVLSGLKYLDEEVAEGFEFALSFNGEILQTVSSDADGKFVFDGLVFTEAGEYVYTIAEVIGDDEEIIYDETVYTITVIVVPENDKLHADVIVTVEEAAHEGEIRFDNTTLTKIPDEDPPLEELPTTGDMGMAPMITALVSMMSLAAVIILRKKEFA